MASLARRFLYARTTQGPDGRSRNSSQLSTEVRGIPLIDSMQAARGIFVLECAEVSDSTKISGAVVGARDIGDRGTEQAVSFKGLIWEQRLK